MRENLAQFVPNVLSTDLLMCPTCGRLLPQGDFSIEHIVPQQALVDDPQSVRDHKEATKNVRSGNILLCKKPLKHNGSTVYENGCNSWKGKWFDSQIREALNGNLLRTRKRKVGGHHIVAMLSAGYLAMVREFGYAAVLLPSGLLMRQQFFLPQRFHPELPIKCQVLMSGSPPTFNASNIGVWTRPFYFEMDLSQSICRVGFKHTLIMLPITADPRSVKARCTLFTPAKYTLRPRFDALFE